MAMDRQARKGGPLAPTDPVTTLDLRQTRRLWMRHAGLDQPRPGTPAEVVALAGWPRTLGGVDAYLYFAARAPHLSPADIDRAVLVERSLWVVPAARSCMYIVPTAWLPLALRFGSAGFQKRALADCAKVGVDQAELQRVMDATVAALGPTPVTTDALRAALPAGVVRSLGEAGKKVGLSTVFPTALRLLEGQGRVLRTPADDSLRQERYLWYRPEQNPLEGLQDDQVAMIARLAEHYFAVAGPATAREFADWSGMALRDVTVALARVALAPVIVEGTPEMHWVLAGHQAHLHQPVTSSGPRLLPFIDPVIEYRSTIASLVDVRHHDRELPATRGQMAPIGKLKALWQRAIFDEGEVVGVWEWDPDASRVVTATFAPLPMARHQLLEAQAEKTTEFLRNLGDARAFSLDTQESLRQRASWVRSMV